MVRTLSLQCYCLWCPILSIWHHVSTYTPRIIAYVMVSYSITTAIVYGVSGSIFFFLIFLLVLIGLEPALRLVLILKEIYKRTHRSNRFYTTEAITGIFFPAKYHQLCGNFSSEESQIW